MVNIKKYNLKKIIKLIVTKIILTLIVSQLFNYILNPSITVAYRITRPISLQVSVEETAMTDKLIDLSTDPFADKTLGTLWNEIFSNYLKIHTYEPTLEDPL